MSIRLKLFLAAFAYVAIIVVFGLFTRDQEHDLGTQATDIYDTVVKGIDYMHKSQTAFVRFSTSHQGPNPTLMTEEDKVQLGKSLDNLDVAVQGAMTEKTHAQGKELRARIQGLQDLPIGSSIPTGLGDIDASLGKLVAKYNDDGLVYRIHAFAVMEQSEKQLGITLGLAVTMALVITLLLVKTIIPPLRRSLDVAVAISQGKLDNVIEAKGNSETSKLLQALAVMQTSIADNIKRIEEQTREVERQANVDKKRKVEMESKTQQFEMQVGDLLETVSQAAGTMKGSAEAMVNDVTKTDSNLQQTITATSHVSASVATVAAAAEELTASINEISQQITRSANMTQSAVQKAQSADNTVKQLSQSAQKINEIVEVIGGIASQINLLALNATIESARAGEAGKGFAVVASEVKALANQTSKATDEISKQINDITTVINAVVSSLTDIQTTINEMGGISSTIAAAMEEQGAATREIAVNIQMTSTKVQEVSATIGEVGKMSKATNENSHNVLNSVSTFSSQSQVLNHEIEKFLKNIATS